MNRHNRSGFTTIELLWVLAITALVMAMAVPRMTKSRDQRGIQAAADEFVTSHGLARATAMRFGRLARLHVDTAAGRFWVEADTSGRGQVGQVGVAHNVALHGVKIAATATQLCFNAQGLSTSGTSCETGAATMTFRPKSGGSNVVTLQITALGKVLR
jgi:Tfp pilus assembly protein FimT